MKSVRSCLLGCCVVAAVATPALAVEFGVSLGYTITDSTNLSNSSLEESQRAVNPIPIVPGIEHTVSASLNGQERAADLDYDLSLYLAKTQYEDNVLDDQVEARGSVQLEYRIRPGSVQWVFADYHFVAADDLVSLSRDDDRAQTNALITGPRLSYRINSVDSANADAFLLNFWRENADDERLFLARADLTRRLNARQSLGLLYTRTQLLGGESDETYSINNLFLRLGNQLPRQGRVETDLGVSYNINEAADGEETSRSALFFQLRANQRFTRTWRGEFLAGRSYTDSALSSLSDILAGEQDALSVASGVFLEDRARASISRRGPVWGVSSGLSWNQTTFDNPADDRKTVTASFDLNYAVTGRLGFFTGASFQELKFSPEGFDRTDTSERFEAGLSWQHTAGFRSQIGWRTSEIDSAGADGLGLFEEEATWYSLTWAPRTRLNLINRAGGQRRLQPLI